MKRVLFALLIAVAAAILVFRYQQRSTPPAALQMSDDDLIAHASKVLTKAQGEAIVRANADLDRLEQTSVLVRPYDKDAAEGALVNMWAKAAGGEASPPNAQGQIQVNASDADQRRIGVQLRFLNAADFDKPSCRFVANAEGIKVSVNAAAATDRAIDQSVK